MLPGAVQISMVELMSLRIWDGVRTESQFQNYMNACLEGNESDLIAYYKFDEVAGETAVFDYTTNANDGALVSMDENTVWQSGMMMQCQWK